MCASRADDQLSPATIHFLSVSWRGDVEHFRWLRRSLLRAGLGDVPQTLVVHSEDVQPFEVYAEEQLELLPTAAVLPAEVEKSRAVAQRTINRIGRRLTRWCTSIHKRTGWFDWVRFAGWQVQQITKLAFAATQSADAVVVLDSDLIITRPFNLGLFAGNGKTAVFEHWQDRPGLWHAAAHRLLGQQMPPGARLNGYVGTPFVLHPPTVRALLDWLQRTYGRPWHAVLLDQPVSSWSEFCTYNLFARTYGHYDALKFVENPHSRDLYREDLLGSAAKTADAIRSRFQDPGTYFTNIPTQRLAAGRWTIEQFAPLLDQLLSQPVLRQEKV